MLCTICGKKASSDLSFYTPEERERLQKITSDKDATLCSECGGDMVIATIIT